MKLLRIGWFSLTAFTRSGRPAPRNKQRRHFQIVDDSPRRAYLRSAREGHGGKHRIRDSVHYSHSRGACVRDVNTVRHRIYRHVGGKMAGHHVRDHRVVRVVDDCDAVQSADRYIGSLCQGIRDNSWLCRGRMIRLHVFPAPNLHRRPGPRRTRPEVVARRQPQR